ncbi:MAG: hypothetical protein AAF787_09705 [Chloroflexota bacterium]
MKKHTATPGSEIRGDVMFNMYLSRAYQESDVVRNTVAEILDKYGIEQIDENTWYPTQITLDVFQQIQSDQTEATFNLVSLGAAYVETAALPPEIDSISRALTTLGLTYDINVRNAAPGEGYEVEQIDPRHIRVRDNNPFPHDVVYGFIWGLAQRFCPEGAYAVVVREYEDEQHPDAAGATYHVTW